MEFNDLQKEELTLRAIIKLLDDKGELCIVKYKNDGYNGININAL